MTKNTEDNGKQVNITSLDMSNDELANRLREEQVKYPSWRPEKEGALIAGKIEDVKDFPFMHQGKGSIMLILNTGLEGDNERVAYWPNTVGRSELIKLRNAGITKGEEPVDDKADFETIAEAIKELVGESIIVQYTGEAKSQDKSKRGLQPYQKFTIVKR